MAEKRKKVDLNHFSTLISQSDHQNPARSVRESRIIKPRTNDPNKSFLFLALFKQDLCVFEFSIRISTFSRFILPRLPRLLEFSRLFYCFPFFLDIWCCAGFSSHSSYSSKEFELLKKLSKKKKSHRSRIPYYAFPSPAGVLVSDVLCSGFG